MRSIVMKFGGTSVGGAQAIVQAAELVRREVPRWEQLTVVVSAMRGVTDALIEGATTAARGDGQTYRGIVADLRVIHTSAVAELLDDPPARTALLRAIEVYLDEFAALCRSIHVLGEVTPRAMDTISALGERMNARVVAARLDLAWPRRQEGL